MSTISRWFIFALILCIQPLAGQHLFLTQPDTLLPFFKQRNVIVQTTGQVYQHSNAITNSFVNKFINGGFIDDELKGAQKIQPENNLFGAGYSFGLNAMWAPDSLFGTSKYGLMVSLSHHDDLSTRLSGDLFNLIFRGNKSFAGQTANLDQAGLRYQRFQQFSIGFFEKKTLSYVQVGLINGNQFIDMNLNEASLFTEANGEHIDLTGNGALRLSDTANTNGIAMNGIGAAINFEVNIPIKFSNRPSMPSYIRFGGQQIGATRWNNNTLQYNIDSTYNYSGFLVDDLANLSNVGDQVEQFVDSITPASTPGTYLLTLPGWFYLSWFSPLSDAVFYEIQVRTNINTFHMPEGRLRVMYKPDNKLLIGVNANYGGYGMYNTTASFRAGVFVSAFVGKNIMINVETDHLMGWFDSGAYSRHAFVNLAYFF